MRDAVVVPAVEHRVVLLQPLRDVVRGEHGDRRGVGEPLGAHHPHVGPRDRQDPRRAVRRRADRPDAGAPVGVGVGRVRREVRRQVCAHADRADPGAATAVRDAEGLVQVQVRHVAAELAGLGVAEERVQVRPVDVHLAPVVVHHLAQLGDGVLVGAVGRGVGDHDRGEVVAVLLAQAAQVVEVDRAVVEGLHHDDLHPGHHRGRRVGAVGRRRDQADTALAVAVGLVEGADRHQAGQLALRAGVGLDRDPVVAGGGGQPGLQLVDQGAVALRVLGRRERVQVGEAGQAHRLHLGGGVELHRARAERDHPAVERVVARRELAQVAQHRGLGAVGVEHLVGHELGLTGEVDRDG